MPTPIRQATAAAFQPARFEALTRRIAAIEKAFGYARFADSARLCYDELRDAGAQDVQLIALPADGQTTVMDFTMPQAWDAEGAELAILGPDGELPLLDYGAMPLCLANRCAPTPPGGLVAEVITATQLHQRARADGLFVYTEGQFPGGLRAEAVAKGVAGLISDSSPAREMAPDATYWINGWGSPGWYHTRQDVPLTCFSIAPTMGALLLERLQQGTVRVRATARTRMYDGSIYTVTGLIPGRQPREIVLMAHIYEPFPCDDAIGAAALIEIARTLTTLQASGALPPLEFGIRFLIGMERYGFAHYFAQEEARRRALLAISMDCLSLSPAKTGQAVEVRSSPASLPFWGDLLLRPMAREALAGQPQSFPAGNLSDDTFVSDRTIGVPSQWVWTQVGRTHHSSLWLREEMNDWALGANLARLVADYAATLATATMENLATLQSIVAREMAEECALQRQARTEALQSGQITSAEAAQRARFVWNWQQGRIASFAAMFPQADTAALRQQLGTLAQDCALPPAAHVRPTLSPAAAAAQSMVLVRKSLGMPFSQARIPPHERIAANYEQALNWVDGQRSVLEVAALVQTETGAVTDDAWLERFMTYCRLMVRYGYLGIRS